MQLRSLTLDTLVSCASKYLFLLIVCDIMTFWYYDILMGLPEHAERSQAQRFEKNFVSYWIAFAFTDCPYAIALPYSRGERSVAQHNPPHTSGVFWRYMKYYRWIPLFFRLICSAASASAADLQYPQTATESLRPLFYAFALLKKRYPSRRLARSTEIYGQTSAECFWYFCAYSSMWCPPKANVWFVCI